MQLPPPIGHMKAPAALHVHVRVPGMPMVMQFCSQVSPVVQA